MQRRLIVSDPTVMMGKPVVAGTRITVELILEKLAAGETVEQILDAHPRLTREAIQAALESFRGLPHRLEFVRELDGVSFYNDSKGTNVGAVVKSLRSFREPIILIAGGKDKGGTYGPLKGIVKEKVKRLILIGEARRRMAKVLGRSVPTTEADTLEEAVHYAFDESKHGDVVLLSPACSSFDMFRDYEERGTRFKEIVHQLKGARRA